MKRFFPFFLGVLALSLTFAGGLAQEAAAPSADSTRAAAEAANTTAAAAAVTMGRANGRTPDLLEHLVDVVLEVFNVKSSGNTATHYAIAMLFLMTAIVFRRVVTTVFFRQLKKLAAKTQTTLDDELFPAMEAPAGAFVMVTGIFAALKVLKLSETTVEP